MEYHVEAQEIIKTSLLFSSPNSCIPSNASAPEKMAQKAIKRRSIKLWSQEEARLRGAANSLRNMINGAGLTVFRLKTGVFYSFWR